MNFVKNFSSLSLPNSIPSGSIGKVGFFFGTLFLGQWVLSDLVHIPGGGLGILAVGAGIWWFVKSEKGSFKSPSTVQGWISRCYETLEQFEELEESEKSLINRKLRINYLEGILERSEPQNISFISTAGVELPNKNEVELALSNEASLNLSFKSILPIRDESWVLPNSVYEQDLLVYVLPLPLRAADLLWLKKIPEDQPSWVMVSWKDSSTWDEQLKDLQAQLPSCWSSRVLRLVGSSEEMSSVLSPIRNVLDQPKTNIEITKQRLLSILHSSWQADLETLRRDKFKSIQNRSQWIVAGAVFASPVPSADLLSVAVVNGLMIQEMAKIWSCKIQPEMLQTVARQLAIAAIAQGVVEWSGQALLGVAKFHGGSWVAAGSMQALSAAYLTRVVGRSMADWMALNNGVLEPDLELLKHQASQLVTAAAEEERVDWVGFLNQGKSWIQNQVKEAQLNAKILPS